MPQSFRLLSQVWVQWGGLVWGISMLFSQSDWPLELEFGGNWFKDDMQLEVQFSWFLRHPWKRTEKDTHKPMGLGNTVSPFEYGNFRYQFVRFLGCISWYFTLAPRKRDTSTQKGLCGRGDVLVARRALVALPATYQFLSDPLSAASSKSLYHSRSCCWNRSS